MAVRERCAKGTNQEETSPGLRIFVLHTETRLFCFRIDLSDLPLILAVTGTHSPHVAEGLQSWFIWNSPRGRPTTS